MTTTSPGWIARALTAAKQASSESNTRAGPRCIQALVAGELDHPALGREDCRAGSRGRRSASAAVPPRRPPPGPALAGAVGDLAQRPAVDARAVPSTSPRRRARGRSARRRRPLKRSVATNRPPGLMSATSGVSAEIVSKSSSASSMPASRAIARRCSTAFVEPPVAGDRGDRVPERRCGSGSATAACPLDQLHHELARVHGRLRLAGLPSPGSR